MGQGKTSFSIQSAIRYCEKYLNESYFSLRKYIAFDNDEVNQKYYNLPEYSPLIADEAARFAMSMDWNKAVNKELKKATMQLRPRHLLFFMNIPNFAWLDKVYRDELVSLWVWIPTRGYAVVFRPDNNPKLKDRWRLKDFEEKDRIDYFTDIERIQKIVHSHKCYFDTFQFPILPKDIEDEYLKLRQQRTFVEAGERFVVQKDLAKIMAYNLRYRWNEFSDAVNNGRKKYPTSRIIAGHLMFDPVKKLQLITHSNVDKWFKEIKEKVPAEVQQQITATLEDLPEEEEKKITFEKKETEV